MTLNKHQLLHLNVVIAEAEESKLLSTGVKNKLAQSKGIAIDKYDTHLDKVKQDAEIIKQSGVFPTLDHISDIHDYLEE